MKTINVMQVKLTSAYKDLMPRLKSKTHREAQAFLEKLFPAQYYLHHVTKGIERLSWINEYKFTNLNSIPNIVIEVSNTCNLNCIMCQTQNSKRAKGEMPLERFERLVAIVKKANKKLIAIHTVGEPLLYSHFADVLRICSENGIFLVITTNGLLLDQCLPLIKKYPRVIKHMSVSIDGASQQSYEQIRRGASFKHLIANLEMIKDYLNSTKSTFVFCCSACLTNENFNQIPHFYKKFAKYFGINNINFSFVTSRSASNIDNPYYKSMQMKLSPLYKIPYPCKLLWGQIHILFDGSVSACCNDFEGELIVGNIKENSLLDIWHGAEYKKLRDRHLKGDLKEMKPCIHCYSIDKKIVNIFNFYLKYLFNRFTTKEDNFYMERIYAFLDYLISIYGRINISNREISMGLKQFI